MTETIQLPSLHAICIPDMFPGRPNIFAMRVTGDAMAGDHISHGDYIIVDPDQRISDGGIAVVMCDRGQAVTRVWKTGSDLLLMSGSRHAPYVLTPDDHPVIRGRVVGAMQSLEERLERRHRP